MSDDDQRAAGGRCGTWFKASGCVLSKRHEGQHRSTYEAEIDRLRAVLAASEQARARLLELLSHLAGVHLERYCSECAEVKAALAQQGGEDR